MAKTLEKTIDINHIWVVVECEVGNYGKASGYLNPIENVYGPFSSEEDAKDAASKIQKEKDRLNDEDGFDGGNDSYYSVHCRELLSIKNLDHLNPENIKF